jgi:hypothetical protein
VRDKALDAFLRARQVADPVIDRNGPDERQKMKAASLADLVRMATKLEVE